jgi:hypothetical protein
VVLTLRDAWGLEATLSKRTYGILASVIGSAIGAWWWSRRRTQRTTVTQERGTVIYDNTPTATDFSEGIV